MDRYKILELILSYFDNIHDFGSSNCDEYCDHLKKFYDKELNIIRLENELISNLDNDDIFKMYYFYKNIEYKSFDRLKTSFINEFINLMNKKEKIKLDDVKEQILKNFKIIFSNIYDIEILLKILNYNFDNDNNIINILNSLNNISNISKNELIKLFFEMDIVKNLIFYQRQHIYYLIILFEEINNHYTKISFDEIIQKYTDFYKLVNYFIKDNTILQKQIIDNIFNNYDYLKNNNFNFPITVFDDTSCGYNIDSNTLFKYKIFNIDKNYIDQAKTMAPESFYFSILKKENISNLLFVNHKFIDEQNVIKHGNNLVYFELNDNIDITIFNYKFYYDKIEKYITCHNKINNINIILQIKKNNIGRKNNNEISLIYLLNQIFNILNQKKVPVLNNDFDKKISEITNIKTLVVLMNNLYNIYKDINEIKEIIIFMVFGIKRFGDWIQIKLSKIHNFISKVMIIYVFYMAFYMVLQ